MQKLYLRKNFSPKFSISRWKKGVLIYSSLESKLSEKSTLKFVAQCKGKDQIPDGLLCNYINVYLFIYGLVPKSSYGLVVRKGIRKACPIKSSR